jgi:hypothetical protein
LRIKPRQNRHAIPVVEPDSGLADRELVTRLFDMGGAERKCHVEIVGSTAPKMPKRVAETPRELVPGAGWYDARTTSLALKP